MLRSRWFLAVAFILALLVAVVVALPSALSALAPRLVFRPLPLRPAEAHPSRWGLADAREVNFQAADGVRLHGWWIPAERRSACGTVIVFHGRSANITTRASAAG